MKSATRQTDAATSPPHAAQGVRLCVGWVRHRRHAPKRHELHVPLFMVECDADQCDADHIDPVHADGAVPSPSAWPLWSTQPNAIVRIDRRDLLDGRPSDGSPPVPLARAVRSRVEAELGFRPAGRIRVLTLPRVLGYVFNPVTFYFCEGHSPSTLDAIVAEITNTPWMERHAYVLDARTQRGIDAAQDAGGPGPARFRFTKNFHVSPFMPMDLDYDWAFSSGCSNLDDPRLAVSMRLARAGSHHFDATLSLTRGPLTRRALAAQLIRCPLLTLGVTARIHAHAAMLWLKGVPVYAHPPQPAARATEVPA